MKSILSIVGALCLFCTSTSAPAVGAVAQERRHYDRPAYAGFEVEVLVGGVPREKLYGRGRSYVEATRGAEYELRIRNPLPVRVGVALSVDGLNTIDARRTSSWDASKWVIEPYGTLRVGGWQMSSARARRFYFTNERDSYASKLGRASDLGVITAVFYREAGPAITYGRPRPHPLEERSERRGAGESAQSAPAPSTGAAKDKSQRSGDAIRREDDDYAATGIGRSVHNQVYRVEMELERRPAAEVTIRYEYHAALVQLGILPRPRPYEDTLGRRERARGFSDQEFCPEP
jgi:hypothetical protein